MTPPIDVVVPVYNRWEMTESCLANLRLQTQSHTMIVCDNGSTDGTPDRLRVSFPKVHVLELGANFGFAAACNRGVRAGSSEIVVLLNNDVDCRPDWPPGPRNPTHDEYIPGAHAPESSDRSSFRDPKISDAE